jgi:phage terminase large subunit-like protein
VTTVAVEGERRVCPTCGDTFVDRSGGRTAPRLYCLTCSPPMGARRLRPPAVKARTIPGKSPFTIAHFRAWAARLRLPGDEPFELEEWQALFVTDVFEAVRARVPTEAWLIVPEGNGKSTLVAVLVLYCVEFSPEAAIPVAAAARDQAEIIFAQGTGFVRRSSDLGARFECKPGLREIVFGRVSRAKIFASDAGTGDGIIPTPIEVIDELHRHKSLDLYRTWAGKLEKERAVLVVISTAGEPGSEFEELREQMRQTATSTSVDGCFGRYVGPASVLHEYAVPEAGDMNDLELVKAANPSSRITVATLTAKRSRPSFSLPHWRRLTCNMPTRSDAAAVTEAEWARAAAPEGEREIPAGEQVALGLDLGWVHDPDFRLLGPAVILAPPGDGSQLDAHLVERALLELHERTPISMVVMDMTKGEQLSQWIEETIGAVIVNRSQGNAMAALDYERFMEGLREGWLRHSGDEGLRRHVLNAVAQLLPAGGTRFNRPRSSRTVAPELQRRRVIDALVAAAMVNTTVAAEISTPAPFVLDW